jgi:tetratricopeptide (TPR) repeat protein
MISDAGIEQAGHESKAKVFISYSRKDMAFADRLEAALKARGFEPLIDRSDIYAFEKWWERIEALIARADTVAFVLSPDAAASDVALKEVALAASLNKRFAPVVRRRVDEKLIPEPLAKLNFIFFDDETQFEQRAEQLAEALRTDIGWIRQHTDFGEQARRWAQAKGPAGLLLRSPVLEQAERWIASRPPGAPAPTDETQTFIRRSRQGATRRRNILTGSLAAGLVLALGLAGLAYWQRGIAVEQRGIAQQNAAQAKEERDNATRNFKLAQKTADSLVIDIARGLRNVQGMSAETVRKILETARATFEQLATSAPDDLVLQRSRSAMLDEFGKTYLTLGDLDQALRAYRDSLAIFERLAAADRSNTMWQHDLGIGHERIGDVLMAQGNLAESLTEYEANREIISRLAAVDRSNTEWQRDLSVSYIKVGDVLVAQGKLDEALTAYRDGLAIFERLAAADLSNSELQRDLYVSYVNVGNVLVAQGKLDDALKAYRGSLAIAERLAAADRSNMKWQRDLQIIIDRYIKVGDVLVAQGKLDEALTAYRDSLAIFERLAAADWSNTQWQRDRSVSYIKVGNVLVEQGKLDESLKAYRDGLAITERLAAADRSNSELQRDLYVSYVNVGNVLVAQGKLDEALKAYREGLAIGERLAAADRSNMKWQRDLQISIDKIGGIAYNFVLARKLVMALEAADQAISLAPEKIWLYSNRAHALMFLDRVDEARALYLKYRGQQNVQDDKSWETVILEDFAELQKAGLTHPLMQEIEKVFTGT